MDTQHLVPPVLFPNHKKFRTAINNIDILRSFYVKCPTILSDFKQIWSFSADFRKIPQYQMLRKSAQ